MALQAHSIYLAAREQARIRGAVRDMTGKAALDFYGGMLENKRPGFIRMAGEAHRILRLGGAQLLGQKAAMLIVTIGALH